MLIQDKAAPGWYPAAAQGNAFTKRYTVCGGCKIPGPEVCNRCRAWSATARWLRLASSALKGTV